MRVLYTALLLALAVPPHAQTLVTEIRPGPDGMSGEPFEEAVVLNGVTYFYADDGASGNELWRSDGTADGTYLVIDLRPGPEGSLPLEFAVLRDHVYFEADDGSGVGRELWRSDGTAGGTQLVADINPGSDDSDPSNLFAFGDAIYFSVNSPPEGISGVWRTDGTSTVPVANSSFPEPLGPGFNFTPFGGSLYFTGGSESVGTELWRVDGSGASATLVKDIDTSVSGGRPNSGFPTQLTVVGNTLFFEATTEAEGRELWRSDGSSGGTVLVLDFRDGISSGSPRSLIEYGGALLFFVETDAGSALWRAEASGATTQIGPTWAGQGSAGATLTEYEGHLYLSHRSETTGGELWRTDGTAPGTALFADLNPGVGNSFPNKPNVFDGFLYFKATDEAGAELWRTDGTAEGTMRIADINPGPDGSLRSGDEEPLSLGDRFVFTANDGVRGYELWTVAASGTSAAASPGEVDISLRVAPNPASSSEVSFRLSEPASVVVDLADALGRRVATLHEGPMSRGAHRLDLPSELPSGAYVVRVRLASGGAASAQVTVAR